MRIISGESGSRVKDSIILKRSVFDKGRKINYASGISDLTGALVPPPSAVPLTEECLWCVLSREHSVSSAGSFEQPYCIMLYLRT